MAELRRLLRKSIWYYRHEGLQGLVYAVLRKVLDRTNNSYRIFFWKRMVERSKGEGLQKRILNLSLYLNPDDQGLSSELAVEGIHEPLLTELLNSLICKGMTVIDIGSNIGYFALLESRLAGPTGKVIAIEPFPPSFSLLQRNIELNKILNIVPRNIAIADRKGKTTMYTFDAANWNSLVPQDRSFASSIEVETETLDNLLKDERSVDAIRMDIEGYECTVIQGMKNILKRYKPLLIVELHAAFVPSNEIFMFLKNLQDIGYGIRCIFPRNKEEIILGMHLINKQKVYEKLSIQELMQDDRMTEFKENFSVVFEPIV